MNKKTMTIILAGLFLVAGCSSETQSGEETTYISAVRYYESKELLNKSDEELISLGRYTCELFDNKVTPNNVIVKVVKKGNLQTAEALDYIVTNALLGFCPEHSDVISYG